MKCTFGPTTHEALKKLGLEDIEKIDEKFHGYLMEEYRSVKAFDGTYELLGHLHERHITMGIVSSRNRSEVYEDECLQKLIGYMDYIICAEDTVKHKPEPEPLLKFMELSGIDRGAILYIGDTAFDAGCAAAAGVRFALALWGAKDADKIKADYYLSKPGELLNVI
jgi:HAD superfamily hydrolase (TIGR01549 family)